MTLKYTLHLYKNMLTVSTYYATIFHEMASRRSLPSPRGDEASHVRTGLGPEPVQWEHLETGGFASHKTNPSVRAESCVPFSEASPRLAHGRPRIPAPRALWGRLEEA